MKLEDIFASNRQTEVLEFLLQNWDRDYTQDQIAKSLDVSASTVSRVAQNLQVIGLVKVWTEPYPAAPGGEMKVMQATHNILAQSLRSFMASLMASP